MKIIFGALVAICLFAMPVTGFSATTVTKIGKVRISAGVIGGGVIRFGRKDGGTFDGCTLAPSYVYNLSSSVEHSALLAVLLSAKQNDLDVGVIYSVTANGRCALQAVEIQ